MANVVSEAVDSILGPHMDSDACAYVVSLLEEDPSDPDAHEAVLQLVTASIEDEEEEPSAICELLFQQLVISSTDDNNAESSAIMLSQRRRQEEVEPNVMRKLDQSVTLKEHDVTTYASGLVASDPSGLAGSSSSGGAESSSAIASFYANMIDASNNPAAQSERHRRKDRQRVFREQQEEEDRQQAIANYAASMLLTEDEPSSTLLAHDAAMKDVTSGEVREDVHLRNFDLTNPSERGGQDLLTGANLTLSYGRRYGLMGLNGCGKTCLLRYISNCPQIKLSMLLVRQEIVGNNKTAVETVLQSNVQRQGLLHFISHTESQLDSLQTSTTMDATPKSYDSIIPSTKVAAASGPKGKKNVKDKRAAMKDKKSKSRASSSSSSSSLSNSHKTANQEEETNESVEAKNSRLADQLARAYVKLAQLEEEEGGDPEPRARKVLAGLGFSVEMQDKPTSALSGGWRMRVSLSCALFANPSFLLLDEPTNHLDLEAVLWLERYLTTQFKGTLLVVSHDRHFLNEVVTDVIHFHRHQLHTYRGDIDSFQTVREENKQRQLRLRETQEAKRAHLQKYIDLHAQSGENGVKASKQRKSRMKKLDKLGVMAASEGRRYKASVDGDAEEVEEYQEDETVVLTFPNPGGFDGAIAQLEQATFAYSDDSPALLQSVDLSIDSKSRVALLGRNGCGKSTLIKLLVGGLRPTKGKATIDGRAKIEYLAQHQLEQLDPDGTPMQTMLDRYPGDGGNAHKMELRKYLANFGLGGDVLPLQIISTMSGGQKCRLCLACAMYRKPHLLVLDEPTNHLDIETTEALISAIRDFKGGVLIVSHDQHLLTSVCKHLYVVEKGHVEMLRQGITNGEAFESYKKAVIQGRR